MFSGFFFYFAIEMRMMSEEEILRLFGPSKQQTFVIFRVNDFSLGLHDATYFIHEKYWIDENLYHIFFIFFLVTILQHSTVIMPQFSNSFSPFFLFFKWSAVYENFRIVVTWFGRFVEKVFEGKSIWDWVQCMQTNASRV